MRLFHDFACGNHSGIVDDTLIPMKKRQCSSQKKLINSLTCHCAKVWMYTAYLQVEFLSKFSVSPKVSWQCGIAFRSCQCRDYLDSNLGRGRSTVLASRSKKEELLSSAFRLTLSLTVWIGKVEGFEHLTLFRSARCIRKSLQAPGA